ncbi:benzoylformate decarboxylase [Tersicoccus phoenicis]|uniref:Benzoylformate decarboxylase n=1 Tax=Tersicoccus phoenicis TaxID=554083 RepID=A0A1R1LJK8_9MICC|nr:benzoylformate decarboxylase [Tersicoccus phoenicis]OMH27723.1 benzoylformate decarboxylase [Tersicoccus phoenicis]
MTTVNDAAWELLRHHGMTTVFGNPGSNELPFLAGMPEDFRYVLGLHEGAVLGMADGFAQATGRPAFVNLHAASGSGNAMGALTNAWYAHTPLVITAGQQVRSTVGQEVMLSNVDATVLPRPLVKHAAEPTCAQDVVRTLSQAVHTATLDPAGPVYVSVPYDDWAAPVGTDTAHLLDRRVVAGGAVAEAEIARMAGLLDAAEAPVLVLGPDVDSARANDDAVVLAERLGADVWVAPSASRCPFPTVHPAFRGVLPASVTGITERLTGHDVVLVIGAPVFRYHQYDPGEYLPAGTRLLHVSCDPGEAARAPMGDAVVTPIGPAVAALAEAVTERGRPARWDTAEGADEASVPDAGARAAGGRLVAADVLATIDALAPRDAVYVNEATSTVGDFWANIRMRRPGSYYFPASGGLGFGMPAAVGVQLADPQRRVIAVIGDGSANYGVTALWSAAQYRIPVVFVILNNGTYGALRGFATKLDALNAPGLDVAGIDFVALAEGYGVPGRRAATLEELRAALTDALAADTPTLIEVTTEALARM